MSTVMNRLAVQSWCFRAFKSNEEVAQLVRKIGLTHIELCGVHIDFKDPTQHQPVIDIYRQAGVTISCIGVQGFSGDEATERSYFEFARKAGCPYMSCSFAIDKTPQAYRVAEKLADEYNINLGIHNHGGWDWLGNSTTLNHVFTQTSPRIGLCLDSAWCIDSGEDPLKVADRFASRLYGVHIKDFIYSRDRKPTDVIIGTGNLKLPDFVQLINTKAPAHCCCTIEYEGDEHNPVPALSECVKAINDLK